MFVDRFAQKVVHSHLNALVLCLCINECRLCYDQGSLTPSRAVVTHNLFGGINPIQSRHIHIHQNEGIRLTTTSTGILMSLNDFLHTLNPVVCIVHEDVKPFQKHLHSDNIDVFVIHDECSYTSTFLVIIEGVSVIRVSSFRDWVMHPEFFKI